MFRVAVMAVLVLLPMCAACGQDKPKETAEQKAVRAYLKENLPSGKFEEIRWWPTKPATAIAPDWSGTVVRLKYRTNNESGGQSVYDHVFTLNGGKIRAHTDDPIQANRDRIFK